MSEKTVHILDAGTLGYGEALSLQRRLVAGKKAGDTRDFLILVEHPPVVTLGRAAAEAHLRVPREVLVARGVQVYDVDRGGDVTYHGPGQLVGYPIIDLKQADLRLHRFLRLIESVLIGVAGELGVSAGQRPNLAGVWTAGGKIAAIGIAVSRWITCHGFALNVKRCITGFELIIPCGLCREAVTSLEELRGESLEMPRVRGMTAAAFARAMGRRAVTFPLQDVAGVAAEPAL